MEATRDSLADTGSTSKYSTIIHGDFWSNNMMFHHDDDGNPVKVKLLDFQMLARGLPSRDIFYFLYVNTDKEFRKNHYEDLLRAYHQVLAGYMKEENMEVTFQEFKAEVDKKRLGGFLGGAIVSQYSLILLSSFSEAPLLTLLCSVNMPSKYAHISLTLSSR